MRLAFEPAAVAGYETTPDPRVLDKIDAVLDELEKDPGQARLRQHRWIDPPLWGVTIRSPTRDFLVLWALEPQEDQEPLVVVHYIGPDA